MQDNDFTGYANTNYIIRSDCDAAPISLYERLEATNFSATGTMAIGGVQVQVYYNALYCMQDYTAGGLIK